MELSQKAIQKIVDMDLLKNNLIGTPFNLTVTYQEHISINRTGPNRYMIAYIDRRDDKTKNTAYSFSQNDEYPAEWTGHRSGRARLMELINKWGRGEIIKNVRDMSMSEMLKHLEYRPEEITMQTYIYIDVDGKLSGMTKRDHQAQPDDEFESIGYVYKHGSLEDFRKELA